MKWIKHDTDANQDAKLQNVLLDYGLEGYGLYWYCIELIAGKVDKDNITFELEHDARIIARNVGSTPQKVEEMMRYFVKIGLFENSQGVITCLKLARRLDKSMTSNAQMREIIDKFKSHDGVMTASGKPMQDKIRSEEIRSDHKDHGSSCDKPKRSKYKYSDRDFECARAIFDRVKVINPAAKEPNFKAWANTVRLMREIDGRTHEQIWRVFTWANRDDFWCSNILSPDKLRKQFDKLTVKANAENQRATTQRKLSPADQFREQLKAEYAGDRVSGESNQGQGLDQFDVSRSLRAPVAESERAPHELDSGDWQDDSVSD